MNSIEDLISDLENKDFDYFLEKMLDEIPDNIDKREGSIVYDAIAPCAMVMAERSIDMINYLKQSHIKTATGEFLDYFANDKGTSREQATYAKVVASITDENNNIVTSVEVGDIYDSMGSDSILYHVISSNPDGTYNLMADVAGSSANLYTGQILPVTPNESVNLATITSVYAPAKDSESDDSLRERLTSPNIYISYGGNITDYQKMIAGIDDVGEVQVYPAFNGGGTVKLVILDNDYNVANAKLISEVKNVIDPDDNSGLGYGLAPIGHKVTVTTPEVLNINVTANVVSDGKIDKTTLNNNIKRNLSAYFETLKRSWAKSDNNHYSMTIYRSQILAIILQTDHVVNAELPLLNGQEEDINLIFDNDKSQLPALKDVIIND